MWHPSTIEPRMQTFSEVSGVTHGLPINATPLDFFHAFLSSRWYDTMAEQTNLYADLKAQQRGSQDPL